MITEKLPANIVNGSVALCPILSGEWVCNQQIWQKNAVMYDWATIVTSLLSGSPDGKTYSIGGFYIEFSNNGGVPMSPPTFNRSGGTSYYNGLSLSGTNDYLRVPITAMTRTSTDDSLFPGGNRLTIFGQTAGAVGVHGKAFSDAADSMVCGASLMVFPDYGDDSQDLVFSRIGFETGNQLEKLANGQIGITWNLDLQ